MQGDLDRTVAAYNNAQTDLARTQAAIKANQTALEEADVNSKIVRNRLAKRADVIYRQGPILFFEYLFGAENVVDFVRRFTFIEAASSLDAATLSYAVSNREKMTRLQVELERKSSQELKILSDMSGQTQSLTESFSKAQALEVKLVSDRQNALKIKQEQEAKAAAESAAKAKADEEARKKAEADAVKLAAAKTGASPSPRASAGASPKPSPSASPAIKTEPGFAIATAGLRCPVGGPVSFTDTWGAPRSGGRSHQGVDMFAASGTPAVAITDGSVLRKTSSATGGITLYLKGNDGVEYYYAHMLKYAEVEQGQKVAAGEAIGYVGNSGNAAGTSPHLHFEVKPSGGGPINPTPTARKACG